ncbi:NAD(P)/FAD-dependent oxidoreductase [Bradyrhizobium sp. STM 3561]|uniref:NAD(P)/FAD-dependent oxidoreductase n=1 Tax=Bradyrhizobium sp. STM 3561 TaxID=578923 RepID=UPI00388D4FD7
MKIGVVGAGIIGSSIAYHLGKAGARVTVFDIGEPGNGVSSTSFACLNAFGQAEADLPFRLDAIKYHSIIARDIGSERNLHTTGTLRLASFGYAAEKLEQNAKVLSKYGSQVEFLSAAAAGRLEPSIRTGSAAEVVFVPEEGWANAGALCGALIELSAKRFAVRYRRERVQGLERLQSKARLRLTTGIEVFDSLVLAAGNDTNALLTSAGFMPLRLTAAPAPLVDLTCSLGSQGVRRAVYADRLHIRPGDHGGFLAGVAAAAGDGPEHERVEEERRSLISSASQWIMNFAEMGQRWAVGVRPMPADGRPMIGPIDEERTVYVAVMCGGITLGPLAGRLVASEIVQENEAIELGAYRPRRSIAQDADWRDPTLSPDRSM